MKHKRWDYLWINSSLATCEQGYGLIPNGAIATQKDKIAWVSSVEDLPADPNELANEVIDLAGACVTPGLIDCHTHLIYAGNRAIEFEKRLQGVSYEEIVRAGGGIQTTVFATRSASEAELFTQSLQRVRTMMANGVTTIEIKSGYGLDWPNELKILRVAKRLEQEIPVTICKTFLGAHAIPAEFQGRTQVYIDLICDEMIPLVAKEKLADAVDVFCEKIAFNLAQTEKVFNAAKQNGLAIKCHAEQLSHTGVAALAAKFHALSVDHLEYITVDEIKAIAKSSTIPVLLPGAFYFLNETQSPPIHLLRQYHLPIAIASDCNPGTSPILSLLLVLNMACTLFHLTPEEALAGVTKHAAQALGLAKTHGTLTVGKVADFVVWDMKHPVELSYYLGSNPLRTVIKNGNIIRSENINY